MYITLQDMLTQIESCDFQCEAGDLRNNTGFQQLIALAAKAEKYRAAYYESQAQLDQLSAVKHKLEDVAFRHGAMLAAPCFCCGYNGSGYFNPLTHECASRHHQLYRA